MGIGEGVNTMHVKNEFIVEFDGITGEYGFSKVGPFKRTIEKASYRPGGAKVPIKDAVLGEYEDITFERAASNDDSVNQWSDQCLDAATNSGARVYKRDAVVKQLGRDGTVKVLYNIYDAFIVEYEAADFDADAAEYTMEKFTISCHRWERIVLDG